MITFAVATSEAAVGALVTEHPADRSTTHPSAANLSLDRAFGPINGTPHIS